MPYPTAVTKSAKPSKQWPAAESGGGKWGLRDLPARGIDMDTLESVCLGSAYGRNEAARLEAGDHHRGKSRDRGWRGTTYRGRGRCVLESIRIAQRSIMLRAVLEPVVIDDGSVLYSVSAGATLATFLPLTNLVGAPGLDRYDPDRWRGRQFVSPEGLPEETITTFGHGPHTCPARPFSTTAIVRVIERLFRAFDLERRFEDARPLPGQIGGVARADGPCNVMVTPRSGA